MYGENGPDFGAASDGITLSPPLSASIGFSLSSSSWYKQRELSSWQSLNGINSIKCLNRPMKILMVIQLHPCT